MYHPDSSSSSDIDSVIEQLDGNNSVNSDLVNSNNNMDRFSTALNLPVVAAYNTRSLFPKIEHFKTDMMERNVSVGFVSEVWEKSESKEHSSEIERMLELNGLKYLSKSRPSKKESGVLHWWLTLRTFPVKN